MIRRLLLLAVVAVLALSFQTSLQTREPDSATMDWDKAAVARYLDARMDQWWQQAKPLKTANSQVQCLSCHTAIPYVLARPALRRAMGVTTPTDHETRLLNAVRARVSYASGDQPYYDQSEDKVIESRGVEAVLNALVLTYSDTASVPASQSTGDARAAMVRLWSVQRRDGAWDWLNFGLEPYETPDAAFHGATLAALAAGSDAGRRASSDSAGQAGIARLTTYLRSQYGSQRLFNRTWALLASARLDGILPSADKTTLLADLRAKQRADGGWSLTDLGPWRWTRSDAPFAPPGTVDTALLAESDGYATGLVVYAMRQAGVSHDDAAVRNGQQWLRGHQSADHADEASSAPWRAHSLNFDREHGGAKGEPWRRLFMSDLATAFGALGLL